MKSINFLLVVIVFLVYITVVICLENKINSNDLNIQRNLRKKGSKNDHESSVGDTVEDSGAQNDEPQDAEPEGGRKKRRKQHSQPHSKEMMRYTRLKKKITKNADKFTVEEISSINQDMDKYLELVNSVPDFQASIKKEHELHREIPNKEVRKAKFDEIKLKYQLEREKYKGVIDSGKDLYKVIRKKIDKKISSELEE